MQVILHFIKENFLQSFGANFTWLRLELAGKSDALCFFCFSNIATGTSNMVISRARLQLNPCLNITRKATFNCMLLWRPDVLYVFQSIHRLQQGISQFWDWTLFSSHYFWLSTLLLQNEWVKQSKTVHLTWGMEKRGRCPQSEDNKKYLKLLEKN